MPLISRTIEKRDSSPLGELLSEIKDKIFREGYTNEQLRPFIEKLASYSKDEISKAFENDSLFSSPILDAKLHETLQAVNGQRVAIQDAEHLLNNLKDYSVLSASFNTLDRPADHFPAIHVEIKSNPESIGLEYVVDKSKFIPKWKSIDKDMFLGMARYKFANRLELEVLERICEHSTKDHLSETELGQFLEAYTVRHNNHLSQYTKPIPKNFLNFVESRRQLSPKARADTSIVMRPPSPLSEADTNYSAFIDKWMKWETLRRTMESIGAHVVISDANNLLPNEDRAIFTRDSLYIDPEGRVHLQDMKRELHPIHADPAITQQFTEKEQPNAIAALIESHALRSGNDYSNLQDKTLTPEQQKSLIASYNNKWREKIKSVKDCFIEGGNLVYDPIGKQLFCGYYVENGDENGPNHQSKISMQQLEKSTGLKIVPIPVIQPIDEQGYGIKHDFYHLDTFLAILPRGEVVVHTGAAGPQHEETIKQQILQAVGESRPIMYLDQEQAAQMPTNITGVGNTTILTKECEPVRDQLSAWGYDVISPKTAGLEDIDWKIRNGGARCLTSFPVHTGKTTAATKG